MFAQRVFEATDRLSDFPRMGRIVPEIGEDTIREIMVQSYRVIYMIAADELVILTIHHGGRPLEPEGS